MATQILLLPGMTPDARVYERLLERLPTATVVPWIEPCPNESLSAYAKRLAESIPTQEDAIVCGVSFGGIVAREVAAHLNAKVCVLISSVRHPRELPPWFRVFRLLARLPLEPMLGVIGSAGRRFPRRYRTSSTARWTKLAGPEGAWHRWATAAVLRWTTSTEMDETPVFQIHGDRDTTFPLRYVNPDVVVRGGGHTLAQTHAAEIVEILTGLARQSKLETPTLLGAKNG